MKNREFFDDLEDKDDDSHEAEMFDDGVKPKPKEEFMLHYERLCRSESNKVRKVYSSSQVICLILRSLLCYSSHLIVGFTLGFPKCT